MSRFTLQKQPENPELKQTYEGFMNMGWLPGPEAGHPSNIVMAMSQRPDLLKSFLNLNQAVLMGGELPMTVKQMISMTIAIQNDCPYCEFAHSGALEAMGVPANVIKSCASDPDLAELPPPQRAIVQFALKSARDPRSITDDDIKGLRDHGFGEGEIIEMAFVAALANFLNSWADVSAVEPDTGIK